MFSVFARPSAPLALEDKDVRADEVRAKAGQSAPSKSWPKNSSIQERLLQMGVRERGGLESLPKRLAQAHVARPHRRVAVRDLPAMGEEDAGGEGGSFGSSSG